MKNQEITVFYKWTAHNGKLQELTSIYEQVEKRMRETEPGASRMVCYVDEENEAIFVHDVFEDAAALGAHLGGTAAHHFPSLAQIATPGPFFFCGFIPDELVQGINGMNMGAEFGSFAFGFDRKES